MRLINSDDGISFDAPLDSDAMEKRPQGADNNMRESTTMRLTTLLLCTASFLIAGAVTADERSEESKPIKLSAAEMDRITAGSLLLPNGKIVFDAFDNPAPNVNGYLGALLGACDVASGAACHPALTRRSDTAFVTGPHVPSVTGLGNDGPWTATVVSPVISCPDC